MDTIRSLVLIAGVCAGGSQAAAGDDRHALDALPPLTGVAVARAIDGQGADWTISVTLGKEVWQTVGQVMPDLEWPGITWERIPHSTESVGTMTFSMAGSDATHLCRVVDLDGNDVDRDRVLNDLATERRLLVSASGRIPEPRYRRLPTQAELIVVLGPIVDGASETSPSGADETVSDFDPATWGEEQSRPYFFDLMQAGKSFRVEDATAAGTYLEGLWRLDPRAHVGGGHYVHADRGDDVTVIFNDSWLVTTVFNRDAAPAAESVHRVKTVNVRSDGSIVVNGRERFRPLDEDHMAMLGYDFIAVVQRAPEAPGR